MPKPSKAAEPGSRKPQRPPPSSLAPAAERHSGEGAASVLENLRRMESRLRRLAGEPLEPPPEDEPPPRP